MVPPIVVQPGGLGGLTLLLVQCPPIRFSTFHKPSPWSGPATPCLRVFPGTLLLSPSHQATLPALCPRCLLSTDALPEGAGAPRFVSAPGSLLGACSDHPVYRAPTWAVAPDWPSWVRVPPLLGPPPPSPSCWSTRGRAAGNRASGQRCSRTWAVGCPSPRQYELCVLSMFCIL